MATSIIKGNDAVEYYALENALGFSTWNGYCIKDKRTKTVRIYISGYDGSEKNGRRATTVPTACLPRVSQVLAGFESPHDPTSTFAGMCRIDSNTGDITCVAATTVRQVSIAAEYLYKE